MGVKKAVSTITEAAMAAVPDDGLARRNAVVLAVAQALAGGNNIVIVATGGIVGAMLAPDRGLATLPVSMMVLGMWIGTLPFGALARVDAAAWEPAECPVCRAGSTAQSPGSRRLADRTK